MNTSYKKTNGIYVADWEGIVNTEIGRVAISHVTVRSQFFILQRGLQFTFLPLLMYQSSSCCRCVSCLRYRTFATPPWPLSPAVAWCGSVRTYWVLSSSLRTSWPSFAVFPWRKERIRPTKAEILERRKMYFHLSCRWEISPLLLTIFHVSKLFGSFFCWCKFSYKLMLHVWCTFCTGT